MNPVVPNAGVRPASLPPVLRFTEADSTRANKAWKATCGPHALAAACGLTLDQVRPALPNYKGWMSPTQMEQSLRALGVPFKRTAHLKTADLCEGISRIQWEGKWLDPGANPIEAYRHTHWVAHFDGWVLCTGCLSAEWVHVKSWRNFHLNDVPPSPFHITHHYKLLRPR